MVNVEYMISYSQVLEILKYIPKEDYDKIPQDMIELFEENKYEKLDFEYNPEKTLQEQNVTKTTKTIIAMLFRDYWATDEQKEKISKVQEQERLKQPDVNNIFKRDKIETKVETIEEKSEKENLPEVIKQENIFTKIIKFFKNIFNK